MDFKGGQWVLFWFAVGFGAIAVLFLLLCFGSWMWKKVKHHHSWSYSWDSDEQGAFLAITAITMILSGIFIAICLGGNAQRHGDQGAAHDVHSLASVQHVTHVSRTSETVNYIDTQGRHCDANITNWRDHWLVVKETRVCSK